MPEQSTADLLGALKAARAWLDLVIEHLDIDPETTRINVIARSPDSERFLAGMTLAESLTTIDATIAEASHG